MFFFRSFKRSDEYVFFTDKEHWIDILKRYLPYVYFESEIRMSEVLTAAARKYLDFRNQERSSAGLIPVSISQKNINRIISYVKKLPRE